MYITAKQARSMRVTDKKQIRITNNLLVCDYVQRIETEISKVASRKDSINILLPELDECHDDELVERINKQLNKDGYFVNGEYVSDGCYLRLWISWEK